MRKISNKKIPKEKYKDRFESSKHKEERCLLKTEREKKQYDVKNSQIENLKKISKTKKSKLEKEINKKKQRILIKEIKLTSDLENRNINLIGETKKKEDESSFFLF